MALRVPSPVEFHLRSVKKVVLVDVSEFLFVVLDGVVEAGAQPSDSEKLRDSRLRCTASGGSLIDGIRGQVRLWLERASRYTLVAARSRHRGDGRAGRRGHAGEAIQSELDRRRLEHRREPPRSRSCTSVPIPTSPSCSRRHGRLRRGSRLPVPRPTSRVGDPNRSKPENLRPVLRFRASTGPVE
jgi:hypothetical protein